MPRPKKIVDEVIDNPAKTTKSTGGKTVTKSATKSATKSVTSTAGGKKTSKTSKKANKKDSAEDNAEDIVDEPVEPVEPSVDGESNDELEENDQELDDTPEESLDGTKSIPEVTNTLKERYEYKPIITSEIVFVTPENRITSEIMTKFEMCAIISERAKQIENGGSVYTDVTGLSDPLEMATKELKDKKCPLDIIRPITEIIHERWHANELAVIWD